MTGRKTGTRRAGGCGLLGRRDVLRIGGALGAGLLLRGGTLAAQANGQHQRIIPSSGQSLPVIGMGSWLTFQVGNDPAALATRAQIVKILFDRGGALIDSSPMYGRSEAVIGYCLRALRNPDALFSATKVWIIGRRFGINQMEHSESLWGDGGFDLMQVHNLLDWETHLETLREWRAAGRIRYIGITTSHGRRHDEMEKLIAKEPIDFVQLTCNIIDREAEQRLLPMAADRGRAVIINRPFRGGRLFDYVRGIPLPQWAKEIDCANWAQFFLKFVISHPAVTCVIPATSRVTHMEENMGAGVGVLPAAALRRRMVQYFMGLV